MYLEIITPKKNIFSGEVDLIKLPGTKGSFEILKNHAPIISTLQKGEIKIHKTDGEKEYFEITGGVVECKKNVITVLAES